MALYVWSIFLQSLCYSGLMSWMYSQLIMPDEPSELASMRTSSYLVFAMVNDSFISSSSEIFLLLKFSLDLSSWVFSKLDMMADEITFRVTIYSSFCCLLGSDIFMLGFFKESKFY